MILMKEQWPELPKWPGVFITGESVTPEQAKDIIFRTDTNIEYGPVDYLSGNDRVFKARVFREFGWTPYFEQLNEFWNVQDIEDAAERQTKQEALLGYEHLDAAHEIRDAWCEEMRIVNTQYVYNTYLSSSYVGGPCGWVSVNGTIHFEGHNYGKWPSIAEVVEDWEALVRAFPYIDLVCTLFDSEACENGSPVCSIVVKNGQVEVHEPDLSLHSRQPELTDTDPFALILLGLSTQSYDHEKGWPEEWISEFAAKSQAAMKKVASWLFTPDQTDDRVEIVQPPQS